MLRINTDATESYGNIFSRDLVNSRKHTADVRNSTVIIFPLYYTMKSRGWCTETYGRMFHQVVF